MSTTSKAALLVVDVQEDFCPPNGSLAVQGGREIAPVINKLLSLPFALKIATRDFHPADHISFASQHADKAPFVDSIIMQNPENLAEKLSTKLWPDHCVQGTPGCELIPELDASKLDKIIVKGTDRGLESFSGFGPPFREPRVAMTELDTILRDAGITQVFCTGIALDVCVKCTAIDAADHGYETYVIRDASRGVDQSSGAMEKLIAEYEQHGVKVIDSEAREVPR